MINPEKLLKLLHSKKSVGAYKSQVRELLGLTESHSGELKLDRDSREFEGKEISFGELAYVFLGRNMQERLRALPNITEADGQIVGASYFANISAFSSTVSGLLDAMILESYQSPQWISDDVFESKETRTNGGKRISVENDGGVNDATLLDTEPYPAVGLKEVYANKSNNERFGNFIQLSELDFIYDRTDKIQSACGLTGEAVRRKKEIRCADVALGIVNPWSSDGNAANTYLTTASAVPNTYVNSSTNALGDWKNIDAAINILGANTSPYSGFEMDFSPPYDVLVSPYQYLNVTSMAKATEVQTRTQTSTEIRKYPNPLMQLNVINMGFVWYNRLIAAGVSATNAKGRWHTGKFKKAFIYNVLIPFETRDLPVSAQEARQDIVMVKLAREHGSPDVLQPRNAYQGTVE